MILSLGMIAAIMLLGFDAPIAPDEPQESGRTGFLRVEATDSVAGFIGGLGDLPPSQVIHLLVEAEDLRCSGQTDRRAIDDLAPEFTLLDPPMAFIGGLNLRGEYRPARAVWPWRKREVGCP